MSLETAAFVDVPLPLLGESVNEGTITRWLVAIGETIERDDSLVEVSTDKVDAEIPSPVTGVLREICAAEGETVAVGALIARIESVESAEAAPTPEPLSETEASPPPEAPAATVAQEVGPATATAPASLASRAHQPHVHATPLARRIATRENVPLAAVSGSGSRGRVTSEDVLRHIAERPAAAATPVTAAAGTVEREPMTRIRRLTAEHMTLSQATSVHVTTVFHVDMSAIVAARTKHKERFLASHGTKLTYLPFILRSLVEPLSKFRQFNASIDGTDVLYKADINLGLAVATERGLLVPVIRHADRLDLAGLASATNDLAQRARERKLKPDEVAAGTFTVTNPGVYGSLFGTPIINQPQVAILCVGTIEKRPVVVSDELGNDAIAIRPMCYFALTYDHRLIDGADAEIFMIDVIEGLAGKAWARDFEG